MRACPIHPAGRGTSEDRGGPSPARGAAALPKRCPGARRLDAAGRRGRG